MREGTQQRADRQLRFWDLANKRPLSARRFNLMEGNQHWHVVLENISRWADMDQVRATACLVHTSARPGHEPRSPSHGRCQRP